MDPHARLTASLLVSLLLWAPFGMAAMRSELDLMDAGVRYLVAFVGCRIAIGGIAHLVGTYRAMQAGGQAAATEPARPEPTTSSPPRRRRTDVEVSSGAVVD